MKPAMNDNHIRKREAIQFLNQIQPRHVARAQQCLSTMTRRIENWSLSRWHPTPGQTRVKLKPISDLSHGVISESGTPPFHGPTSWRREVDAILFDAKGEADSSQEKRKDWDFVTKTRSNNAFQFFQRIFFLNFKIAQIHIQTVSISLWKSQPTRIIFIAVLSNCSARHLVYYRRHSVLQFKLNKHDLLRITSQASVNAGSLVS